MSTIADRLRSLRRSRGLSIREFADALEAGGYSVSRSAVSQYERGTRVPAEYVAAVARTFQVGPTWLLTGKGLALDPGDPGVEEALGRIAGLLMEMIGLPRPAWEPFGRFLEVMPYLLAVLDSEGRIIRLNEEWRKVLGCPAEEWVGRHFLEVGHFTDPAEALESFRRIIAGSESAEGEDRIVLEDGTERTLAWQARAVDDELFVWARDVTEEAQARRQARQFREALEWAADCILITDREGVILYVNPAFERTTGYPAAEAVGRTPAILRSGVHDDAFYRKLWDTILGGEVFRAVLVNRKRNGECYYDARTIAPMWGEEGEIAGFVSTGRPLDTFCVEILLEMGRLPPLPDAP